MRILKLELNNYGCWNNLIIPSFSKYNVFIGENSSGKSTILEAIYNCLLNHKIEKNRIHHSFVASSIFTYFSYEEDNIDEILNEWTSDHDIGSELIDSLMHYENSPNLINPLIKIENFSKSNNSRASNFGYVKEERIPEDVNLYINKTIKLYRKHYKTAHIPDLAIKIQNHYPKQVIQIPSKRRIATENTGNAYGFSNTFDGNNLKRMLHDAKNSDNSLRIKGYNKFQNIVENWSFSPGRPDIIAKAGSQIDLIFWKSENENIKIEEVGDGVKQAVIIAGVCLTYPEKIFLIEEPELHLHPRALRELRDLLKHEISGQVFITTHNPVFINEIDNETTVVKIIKEKNTFKAIPISNREELRKFKQQFGLLNSDFLFEDSLVFVEGLSDKLTFESWFELLYPMNHSVRFITVGGKHEINPVLVLSIMLQLQQNFSIFSILDSDKMTPEQKKKRIIDDLKGKYPQLVEEYSEERIKENIYVLNKKKIESYFIKAPRILAEWLNVEEDRVRKLLDELKGSADRKLRILAKKLGEETKSFKKVRDLPKLVEIMEAYEIDPEIKRLLHSIQTLNKTI